MSPDIEPRFCRALAAPAVATLLVAEGAEDLSVAKAVVLAVVATLVWMVGATLALVSPEDSVVEAGTSVATVEDGFAAEVEGTAELNVLDKTTSHICVAPGSTSPRKSVNTAKWTSYAHVVSQELTNSRVRTTSL